MDEKEEPGDMVPIPAGKYEVERYGLDALVHAAIAGVVSGEYTRVSALVVLILAATVGGITTG